jgi:hypothetical protein
MAPNIRCCSATRGYTTLSWRVEYQDGDRWEIVNSGEQTVFAGNKLQAEEWLDCQENAQWQSSSRTVVVSSTPSSIATLSLVQRLLCNCRLRINLVLKRGYSALCLVAESKSCGPQYGRI